jgi:glycine cleavage system regulatory protein
VPYHSVMASLVLTAIGDDRAGLVSALAEVIIEHGGNWEQSRMAELAGKFAGIVQITVPDARADQLVAALEPLGGVLDINVQIGTDEPPTVARVTLDLVGTDRPGIVHEISHVLAGHGVSIEQLTTGTSHAPMAGGMLFEARAVLELPAELDRRALQSALESVANELMVDLDIYVDD